MRTTKRMHTVIVGAGQAGLSVGYHLALRGVPFVILEANGRIGDTWRSRWDSLRLFTQSRFDGLDGMPFPAAANEFPTKEAMAAYLEAYAARFALPVRTGVQVHRVTKVGDRFLLEAGDQQYEADNLVVAMATYQRRQVPAFATQLAAEICQMHSLDYRRPAQLRPGGVLIVGAGNSGSEIALELARAGHRTWMSGRDTGYVPFKLGGRLGRLFLTQLLLRFVFHRVLTLDTPMGRKVRPKIVGQGGPLIRVKPEQLSAAGVTRVPRTVGVRDGRPMIEGGDTLDVTNVIWCTGFHPGFSWIDLPVFGADGRPEQQRGVVQSQPGLYFVGLNFLYALSSTMVHGVGRDAAYIADQIVARNRPAPAVEQRGPELISA